MWRAVIVLSWFFVLPIASRSQHRLPVRPDCEDTRLALGISAGITDSYNFKNAINVQLRWQHDFSPYLSGLLGAGYTSFAPNERVMRSSEAPRLNIIPIKAGLKVFPVERVYISGEAGLAFASDFKHRASFTFAPSVGFEFYEGLDIGLGYDRFRKYETTHLALKVSYGFNLTRYSGYVF